MIFFENIETSNCMLFRSDKLMFFLILIKQKMFSFKNYNHYWIFSSGTQWVITFLAMCHFESTLYFIVASSRVICQYSCYFKSNNKLSIRNTNSLGALYYLQRCASSRASINYYYYKMIIYIKICSSKAINIIFFLKY